MAKLKICQNTQNTSGAANYCGSRMWVSDTLLKSSQIAIAGQHLTSKPFFQAVGMDAMEFCISVPEVQNPTQKFPMESWSWHQLVSSSWSLVVGYMWSPVYEAMKSHDTIENFQLFKVIYVSIPWKLTAHGCLAYYHFLFRSSVTPPFRQLTSTSSTPRQARLWSCFDRSRRRIRHGPVVAVLWWNWGIAVGVHNSCVAFCVYNLYIWFYVYINIYI